MTLAINDTAPDFEAETTEGKIRFHDWIGDKWVVLFSHPKDFTPVCTTELGYMAKIKPEFDKRGVKIIGLSVDPLASHHGWSKDIKETQGHAPNYPRTTVLFRHVRARVMESYISNRMPAHQHVEVCFNDDRYTLHKNWTRML